ncbi:MAG: TlpA family protein disulfide reductase [Microscillaceae bacterium]|nr:TlpA family protein disulfide reductase [Microscillaceae bacterium]MDW8460545.1 TlpA disulfide reductase family protein [Cytophagales bacterium]
MLYLNCGLISHAQIVKEIKLPELQKMINTADDTTRIFNFWFIGCKPCVKEMPYFEEVNQKYKDKKVKVIFVHCSELEDLDKVAYFVEKKKIKAQVVKLSENNPNYWIPRIDKSWQGSTPATIFINHQKKKRLFFEKPFTLAELEQIINNF